MVTDMKKEIARLRGTPEADDARTAASSLVSKLLGDKNYGCPERGSGRGARLTNRFPRRRSAFVAMTVVCRSIAPFCSTRGSETSLLTFSKPLSLPSAYRFLPIASMTNRFRMPRGFALAGSKKDCRPDKCIITT